MRLQLSVLHISPLRKLQKPQWIAPNRQCIFRFKEQKASVWISERSFDTTNRSTIKPRHVKPRELNILECCWTVIIRINRLIFSLKWAMVQRFRIFSWRRSFWKLSLSIGEEGRNTKRHVAGAPFWPPSTGRRPRPRDHATSNPGESRAPVADVNQCATVTDVTRRAVTPRDSSHTETLFAAPSHSHSRLMRPHPLHSLSHPWATHYSISCLRFRGRHQLI